MTHYPTNAKALMIGFIGLFLILLQLIFFPDTAKAQIQEYTAVSMSKGYYDGVSGKFVWKALRPCNIQIEVCSDNRTITIKTKPWIVLTWYQVSIDNKDYFVESTTEDGIYVLICDQIQLNQHTLHLSYPDYAVRYNLRTI